MDEETKYYLAFSVFPGIGPLRFHLLREYFHTAQKAWHAPLRELIHIGLGEKLSKKFHSFRSTFDVNKYIKKLQKEHVSILTIKDKRYPPLLKAIPDAPFVLYIKGKQVSKKDICGKKIYEKIDLSRTIAVVGTRKITPYGKAATEKIVSGLVSYGCTVVSGLAYGVDAHAHKTAILAGGKTIAVLGCGVDIIAPPSNVRLYNEIAYEGYGAVISEMPLGMRPNKGLFPARNRIISGISLGVVVIEGAEDSGALITASYAAEQGREVFAVPGPITSPYSRAASKLIKSGARLIESAEDIVEELKIRSDKADKSELSHSYKCKTKDEQVILKVLGDSEKHIDDIVHETGLTAGKVSATLTFLEMKGIVKDSGDKIYKIT